MGSVLDGLRAGLIFQHMWFNSITAYFMKNFWVNTIDRALRRLGYMPDTINGLLDKEKEAVIIEQYLYILREDNEDCMPLSLEEMAEYVVDYFRKGVKC
jgi:hypothetical protein